MVVLPVSAAAARGWGVTYGGRRVGGGGGREPGGGRGALGGVGGARDRGAATLALAEVPLALAYQRPLVALHALQLLLGAHAAPWQAAPGRRLLGLRGRGQALQGTLGSLLGKRAEEEGRWKEDRSREGDA